jgi:hypothetical protein
MTNTALDFDAHLAPRVTFSQRDREDLQHAWEGDGSESVLPRERHCAKTATEP